jgi:unsaturated rhamnogalacturonyl hydrolase
MKRIERYVQRILAESAPDRPLWNIEKIKEGKINGWNYIDGCMMIALLNLYRITGQECYYEFAERFLDYYVFEDGSLRGFKEEDYNLDNICEGRVLFDVYALSGKEKYRRAIETLHGQILRQPRTCEGNFWHKAIYPNQVWLDGLYMAQVFYARYTTDLEGGKNYADIDSLL